MSSFREDGVPTPTTEQSSDPSDYPHGHPVVPAGSPGQRDQFRVAITGVVYLLLTAIAAAAALWISFPLYPVASSCEASGISPELPLAILAGAVIPLLSTVPPFRDGLSPSIRAAGTIAPVTLLVSYCAIMFAAAAFGAASDRSGAWTIFLVALLDISPLLSLSGGLVVGCIPVRAPLVRVISVALWTWMVTVACWLAPFLHVAYGCAL